MCFFMGAIALLALARDWFTVRIPALDLAFEKAHVVAEGQFHFPGFRAFIGADIAL